MQLKLPSQLWGTPCCLFLQLCLVSWGVTSEVAFPLPSDVYLGRKTAVAIREWDKFAFSHYQEAIDIKAEMWYLLRVHIKVSFLNTFAKYFFLLSLSPEFFHRRKTASPQSFSQYSQSIYTLLIKQTDTLPESVFFMLLGTMGASLVLWSCCSSSCQYPSAEILGFFPSFEQSPEMTGSKDKIFLFIPPCTLMRNLSVLVFDAAALCDSAPSIVIMAVVQELMLYCSKSCSVSLLTRFLLHQGKTIMKGQRLHQQLGETLLSVSP